MLNVLQKAPNSVVYGIVSVVIVLLVCFTVLIALGDDTADLRSLMNVLMNAAGIIVGSGGLLYASAAARTADKASSTADSTNAAITNGVLQGKINEAIQQALKAHDSEVHGIGGS